MSHRTLSHIGICFLISTNAGVYAQTSPTTVQTTVPADESIHASLTLSAGDATTTEPAGAPVALSLDGYLAPIDPFEAKLTLKQFAGPLKVTQTVPHGTSVKAGDLLVSFDTTDIDEAIILATSELETAKANLAKNTIDNTLGEQADTLGLAIQTDAVADAQAAVDWWNKNDGPNFLKQLELQLKGSEAGVADQEDELDQLRKMYKSEELTNATADIVVRRAVRQLEQSKVMLEITRGDIERRKATEYVDRQQMVERNLTSAQQSLEATKAQAELSKVQRAAGALQAKTALKNAEKKLIELEEDKAAMTVKSKVDGVALFGAFDGGAWSGSEPDTIRVGEKRDVSSVFLTVVTPGKLKAIARLDEAKVFTISGGEVAKVTPAAIESVAIVGKTVPLSPLTSADGTYALHVDLAEVDARLLPGMKVKIEIEGRK